MEFQKIYPFIINAITSFLPFLAALITAFIAIRIARNQNKATLEAAKIQSNTSLKAIEESSKATIEAATIQSEATLKSMKDSLTAQIQSQKLQLIQNALSDIIVNLYLLERLHDFQNPKPMLNAIATLQSSLGNGSKEREVKIILDQLKSDLIDRGDLGGIKAIRINIESKGSELIDWLTVRA